MTREEIVQILNTSDRPIDINDAFDLLLNALMLVQEQRDYWIELMSLGKTIELHKQRLTRDDEAVRKILRGET